MHFVSHALEWVRALLSGPWSYGEQSAGAAVHASTGRQTRAEPMNSPAHPNAWLAFVRPPPDERAARLAHIAAHPLVRVYVLPPEERHPALRAWHLMGVSR
ncbi:hypothetical protein [Streptomyces europaeiscabiei]|uniref:Uncharacterized protein n=1 Tax=Streptomyces europaeiscabiei TaxID=146819 RepID=A0ABU4NUX0_9ACTN|nr:hypothetical protein [Streptomyces europaeiscabiei]MDX2530390.1 hypothetical protein [Streptomyces europaeiscabiei]MDX2765355.1 hypothetical protein [Streptomyces europaeiscabiei]MDX3549013.1 hypothetical protein [Streptomyces europaeiscabiei]MDX3555382.1 hypothetical protein [Streptomyces europaeiscabiei]MDX3668385.1 hypothetical protein [Streptomyces europaeiscabiei]